MLSLLPNHCTTLSEFMLSLTQFHTDQSSFIARVLCDVIVLGHEDVVYGVHDAVTRQQVRRDGAHPQRVSPPAEHDVVGGFGARGHVLTVQSFYFVRPLHQLIETVITCDRLCKNITYIFFCF